MEKVYRGGKVAVAVSPGFGAGWTTRNRKISPFEPKIIIMIEKNKQKEITEDWCKKNLGIDYVFCGGVDNLEIDWLPIGTKFSINVDDGYESIFRIEDFTWEA